MSPDGAARLLGEPLHLDGQGPLGQQGRQTAVYAAEQQEVTPGTLCACDGSHPFERDSQYGRAVSVEEFHHLAVEGKRQLDSTKACASPTTCLDQRWESIKSSAYSEAQGSWGGATIDAHTAESVATDADKYVVTIREPGQETVCVPDDATQERFSAAMDEARGRFGSTLEQQGAHLGVFHDDTKGRIEIDPVLVVDTPHEVETIGAYSHAIDAYHFASGDPYRPPCVAKGPRAITRRLDGGPATPAISTTKAQVGLDPPPAIQWPPLRSDWIEPMRLLETA